MIILDFDQIVRSHKSNDGITAMFCSYDDGDVQSMLKNQVGVSDIQGTLTVCDDIHEFDFNKFTDVHDKIRVVLSMEYILKSNPEFEKICDMCCGWVLKHDQWVSDDVRCVSVKSQLFSRFGGILESGALGGKKASIFGNGSFGSEISNGLVKSGLTDCVLVDDDRLDVSNIMRHVCGLSHVGRYKTKVLKEMFLDKNPTANIKTYEKRVNWDNIELIREIIRASDIVVCVIDDREGKIIINRLCVEEKKTCVYAGAFRRAYGGQILRIRPHTSLCYQCFLQSLPTQAGNEEISNQRQADAISYSDRPVPVEPGLANDIAPITQMVCKLVIQELLKGHKTTLRSLDDDLVAPMYLWFNRREKETDQENWEPLEFDCDGLHILRWYGVAIAKNPACPVCGDFTNELAKQHGLNISGEG